MNASLLSHSKKLTKKCILPTFRLDSLALLRENGAKSWEPCRSTGCLNECGVNFDHFMREAQLQECEAYAVVKKLHIQ